LPIPTTSKLSPKDIKAIAGLKSSKRKIPLPDPRPFQTPEPSESDLLALHRYLSSQPQSPRLTITAAAILTPPSTPNPEPSIDISNPLNRYTPEPACPLTCPDCVHESGAYSKAGEQLDWVRITASLKSPKWVFDGRGIIDVPEMNKLGVRVEAIGKPSTVGR